MTLAERLTRTLERRGLNMREAATKSGVAYGTMHNLVSGTTENPSLATLGKIGNALNVPIQWLANGTGRDPFEDDAAPPADEETPEQAMAATMPDVSFLLPKARAIYDRAVGSYLTRNWPQPIIERAAWDLVNYIVGANTLRSEGPGRPELTEDEQVMVLERTTKLVEKAYGPNGVMRRF